MEEERRKKIETFEDLLVWQKSIEIVKQIYLISTDNNLSKDFALRGQLRRAALSIPSNIAEGFERSSKKEYLNFLNFAKGSAGELRSLLLVASEIGYLDPIKHNELRNSISEISRYLSNQIKSLRKSSL
ncbi:MAG: four helix bundle protein [Syntrophales bacterium]|nr:four helix bundle protein [Syntrophales bacterium]MDD5640773.1 four helix bundle protein [Syntrophales bacterium]